MIKLQKLQSQNRSNSSAKNRV